MRETPRKRNADHSLRSYLAEKDIQEPLYVVGRPQPNDNIEYVFKPFHSSSIVVVTT